MENCLNATYRHDRRHGFDYRQQAQHVMYLGLNEIVRNMQSNQTDSDLLLMLSRGSSLMSTGT